MNPPKIAVIGAGVFGTWTAWHLLQRGAQVTLLDAWGPANSRSSSGDESRILRGAYGDQPHYVELTDRSLTFWEALEVASGLPLFRRAGALWLFDEEDSFVTDCLAHLQQWKFPLEQLDVSTAPGRFPQVNWSDVRTAYLEHRAGYLLARRSIQALLARFEQGGGLVRLAHAAPRFANGGRLQDIRLGDGSILEADRYVFACGPWLGELFPDWIGPWLRPTRQEVFYFGTPAGNPAFTEVMLPAWIDGARGSWYGIPGNEQRGFKISSNELGEVIDPSTTDRAPDPIRLRRAREHLAHRFPKLAGAPLLESRVCQYENTSDRNLIIDRFPGDPRVLALGGGSGHGFKMGPAIGELAATIVLDEVSPPERFQMRRFAGLDPEDPDHWRTDLKRP